MGRAMRDSVNRVSIMRSKAPRFAGSRGQQATPFGVYDVDTAHQKGMASRVRDSRRFYSATFNHETKRFAPDSTGCAPDIVYDAKQLYDARQPTVFQAMENSPVRCAMMRSRQKRMTKVASSEDNEYEVDTLNKSTVATSVKNSPILYANMCKSKTQRSALVQPTSCPRDIGPGAYDTPYHKDVRVSLVLNQNPLSSFVSLAPRMATDKVDPTKNLGSLWKIADDQKQFWGRNVAFSTAEYLRPQYLPKVYAEGSSAK